jgi:hypothetical protein
VTTRRLSRLDSTENPPRASRPAPGPLAERKILVTTIAIVWTLDVARQSRHDSARYYCEFLYIARAAEGVEQLATQTLSEGFAQATAEE